MQISKSTFFVFLVVITVMTLSVTVFKGGKSSGTSHQHGQRTSTYQDRPDRYPVAADDDLEPNDPIKRAKLKKQKKQYDKDAPFNKPGPQDGAVEFYPEGQFDFPALPVSQSDVIVIGEILHIEAHRSNNKLNVFSNLDVRVDEVLKGSVAPGSVITIQRIGGFVKYPDGRKVLFRLVGNGMPGVGGRYALFLKVVDDDNTILTGYEFTPGGVIALDMSRQFEVYQGETETNFLKALRDAVLHQPVPPQE